MTYATSDGLKFTSADGAMLRTEGRAMRKKPNPVFMLGPMRAAFVVDTNEGQLAGQPGDFVAHDPISGHVWPVAASYVAQHYDPIEVDDERVDAAMAETAALASSDGINAALRRLVDACTTAHGIGIVVLEVPSPEGRTVFTVGALNPRQGLMADIGLLSGGEAIRRLFLMDQVRLSGNLPSARRAASAAPVLPSSTLAERLDHGPDHGPDEEPHA